MTGTATVPTRVSAEATQFVTSQLSTTEAARPGRISPERAAEIVNAALGQGISQGQAEMALSDAGFSNFAGLHRSENRANQELLAFVGGDLGPNGADGRVGPRTEAAIKEFQREHNLPESGAFDNDTVRALNAEAIATARANGAATMDRATRLHSASPRQSFTMEQLRGMPNERLREAADLALVSPELARAVISGRALTESATASEARGAVDPRLLGLVRAHNAAAILTQAIGDGIPTS